MSRLTTLDEQNQPSIIVDPAAGAGAPAHVQRVTSTKPKLASVGARNETPKRGLWIVILAYLVAGGALAAAIYERFFA